MARLPSGVRKKSNGTYEKRFTIEGKRYSVGGRTQKEVLEREIEVRKLLAEGTYRSNCNITLDQWYEEWEKQKILEVKGSSIRVYRNQYKKHISPAIGKVKVQKLEKREVKNMMEKLPETLSTETYNSILRVIKLILHDAVREEVISKNPADGIKSRSRKKTATKTYHRALTIDEQKVFMDEIKNDYYYEFIALMISTGMRQGEVVALEWKDIDYANNVIHITKTMTTSSNGKNIIGDSPKSDSGYRDIPITENIKNILKTQKEKMRLLNGIDIIPIENRIFQTSRGNMPSNEVINRAISEALERLKKKGIEIEHFTSHALRDTFATRYIEQGGNPQTLKTILGHSSLAMTMDLYSHVLPNTKQEEMDRIKISI